MSDEKEKMNLSVNDVKGQILVVSQFTLYADTSGGNRHHLLMPKNQKKRKTVWVLYRQIKIEQHSVETGSFGDYMKIEAYSTGPLRFYIN